MREFTISRSPVWRMPLLLIGATAERSKVTLEGEHVDVRFGAAHVRIPYANIQTVSPRPWSLWLGIGIRVARAKTLGLVGSTSGVVQIALKAPSREGVLFMRHPLNIAVSLDDSDGFIRALEARLPGSAT